MMTEEPRPTHSPALEHYRPACDISTIDERKDYIELHKYLQAACAKMLKLAVSTFSFRGKVLRPPHQRYQHLSETLHLSHLSLKTKKQWYSHSDYKVRHIGKTQFQKLYPYQGSPSEDKKGARLAQSLIDFFLFPDSQLIRFRKII